MQSIFDKNIFLGKYIPPKPNESPSKERPEVNNPPQEEPEKLPLPIEKPPQEKPVVKEPPVEVPLPEKENSNAAH